jgi:hypothetical protein
MQGRSKRQQDNNEKLAAVSTLLLLSCLAIVATYKLMGWPL